MLRSSFSTLFLWTRQFGRLELKGLCTAGMEAERLVDEHVAAVTSGVGVSTWRDQLLGAPPHNPA